MSGHLALIGAGAMGGAIGARLLQTGHEVTVFDPAPDCVARLTALGASAAPSAADAVRGARAVILSLNSARIVRAAALGPMGVADGAEPGLLVIDMSSIDPDETRKIAQEAAARGLRWVDSPLSGGIPKAVSGTLTLMQGGSAEDVREANAVLSDLAARQTRLGDTGAGQGAKLINQLLCGLNFLAVAEATALAEAMGVDPVALPPALAGGRADSALLQEYMPRYAGRDYRRTGRIDNMVKDLDGALAVARAAGTALPLTALCAEVHRMLVAAGLGGEDQAALMEFFKGPDKEAFR